MVGLSHFGLVHNLTAWCRDVLNGLTGTTLHFLRALSHPRWEDFNFEPLEGSKNRFHWFGNGQTQVETTSSTNSEPLSPSNDFRGLKPLQRHSI